MYTLEHLALQTQRDRGGILHYPVNGPTVRSSYFCEVQNNKKEYK